MGNMYMAEVDKYDEQINKITELPGPQKDLQQEKLKELTAKRDEARKQGERLLIPAKDLRALNSARAGMNAQYKSMKASGDLDELPASIRTAFETALNSDNIDMWKSAQTEWIKLKEIPAKKWEPTTKEEALEFEEKKAALRTPAGYRPQTKEEALEFEKEKTKIRGAGGIGDDKMPLGIQAAPPGVMNEPALEGLSEAEKAVVKNLAEYKDSSSVRICITNPILAKDVREGVFI